MSLDIKQPSGDGTIKQDAKEGHMIPVVQEFLNVSKQTVETGTVRVSKKVEEKVEDVSMPLMHEEIVIDRVPIGTTISAEAPLSRYEGDTLIIPVVKEEYVVQKRLILVEEVRITKRTIVTEFKEQVKLRKEVIEVKEEKKD
ncbi:MAG TPA: YsnF/AvaK domain-containing protein [Chryseolinea sp.]|jgi:uncharacterized protein (TIGR02271 family)|nr:YsnF/AvaK domain-containing protein [Chryseolinea sp.]